MERQIIWNQDQTWTLEGTQMQVEVILASQGPGPCPPIYTLRMRYPRIIHAEVMTHRVFSRNARSSRAVPVKTMLEEVRSTPFVPWHWGKNQKGMQAGEECSASVDDWWTATGTLDRTNAWCAAAVQAVNAAEAFDKAGYHKQICNRLLEPFMWIDVLVTSTEWENFLWLRNHEAAEPHLQDLARLVEAALDDAEVQMLEPGEWHLPYITRADLDAIPVYLKQPFDDIEFACRISAARCARISYKPFDGDASYERELERYDSLVSSDRVHASPLEHQATPDTESERFSAEGELVGMGWDTPHLHGNLCGWRQWRKMVPGENHAG